MKNFEYENQDGEHQIYGSPGCGKTTYMTRQIKLAAQKHGSDNILVASFTTSAAQELVSRDLPLKKEQVATLHAHAYRAIGKPRILETDKELLAEWNKKHPQFCIGKAGTDVDNPHDDGQIDEGGEGNEMLARYQLQRARRSDLWASATVKEFAARWEKFKADTNSIDYTDMIALALDKIPYAPGNPNVMFIDEAQDLTALEWALVRKWGKFTEHLIVAGDDDQCIYGFKGASAETFYGAKIPDSHKHILTQSYRVPQVVHKVANRWVQRLSNRQQKEYKPRINEDGSPVLGESRWLPDADYIQVDNLLKDAEYYLRQGKTIMILASCAYMLNNLKSALRSAGLPFHNPFRKKRGDWSPLGQGKGVAAILAYLAPSLKGWKVQNDAESWQRMIDAKLWTKEELDSWLSVMSISTFLKRGAGKQIEEADQPPTALEFARMLEQPEDFVQMVNGHLGWFIDHLQKANVNKFDYICNIIEKHRVAALKMTPPIVIGTIHSVKGGEADVVYLMPDISKRAYDNYATVEGKDEVIRQFYVGMTRCKESLVLLSPASNCYIRGLNNFILEK
jgi:DNA helicase II / ATP-dependent DNA helicase PcrA